MLEKENRFIELALHRLDCVALEKEAIWGIGNLLDWMDGEFKGKWDSQQEKLVAAVASSDENMVRHLVDGCIRAWGMMEQNAIDLGKSKAKPEYMEIKLPSGFHLRVATDVSSARMCTDTGVHVWSLSEVARVIESDFTLVGQVKDLFPDAEVTGVVAPAKPPVDFEEGDEIGL